MSRGGTVIAVVLLAGLAVAGCTPPETNGQPEPAPVDQPELYAELDRALHAPAAYEGGDLATCGAWTADDPEFARQMLAECPPLTKGELP